jgi:putative sugar O-methyltransferase
MNSMMLSAFHLTLDKFLRVRNRARRFLAKNISNQSQLSDSETSFYVPSLVKITETAVKQNFRRNFDYREILEHVDFRTGQLYLDRIKSLGFDVNQLIRIGLPNDSYGNPRTYKYENLPRVSPTTLRYLAVACEISTQFDSLDNANIIEIGAGYGGQLAILSRMYKLESYSIYDLPQAQELTKHYLTSAGVDLTPKMLDVNQVKAANCDLIISNYAFSELPSDIQMNYLTNVLANSTRGYLIMNSGKLNETGRSKGKLHLSEIRSILPDTKVLPEIPLTGPDNYVLTWGSAGTIN